MIWNLLQFRSETGFSKIQSDTLFHASLAPPAAGNTPSDAVLDIIVSTSPQIVIDTADGGQAAPVTAGRDSQQAALTTDDETLEVLDTLHAPAETLLFDASWMWTDADHFPGDSRQDPYEPRTGMEPFEASAWWNLGNL